MKCAACGTENKEAALFCKACGAGVVQATVSSGAAEAPPVGVVCRKCGHTNRIGLKFCGACGERMGSDGSPVAPPVPPPRQARPAAEPVGSTLAATAAPQSATPGSKPAASARGSKLVTAGAATPLSKLMFASIGLVVAIAGAAGYFWLSARKSEAPLVPAAAPITAVTSANGSASQAAEAQAQASASAAAASAVASPTAATAPAPEAVPATAAAHPAATAPALPLPARPPSTITPTPPAIQAPPAASPEQSARVPELTPQRVAPSKPPVSREQPREARAVAPVPEQRPPTTPAAPPPPQLPPRPQDAAPPRQTEGDWYARLQGELSRCKSAGNFLARTICEEKSKIFLCGVGNHWGQVPECVQTNTRRLDSN